MSLARDIADLGSSATKLDAVGSNLIINGAMQVAQRGTSVTSISTEGYKTVDRFRWTMDNTSAVFTHSQSTDVPSGQGFANSFKTEVTTADASLAANNQTRFEYRFEGQDVQQLAKGTSNAKKVTLSFWVKAYQAGTYIVNIQDTDNSRLIAATYTVNASATWEYKTITFDGDTSGTLTDDNNLSLVVHWYLGAGSDYTSGTLASAWESLTTANRAVGQTVDIASSTSNYWAITGVQLEVGDTATDFEHRSANDTLQACERYFQTYSKRTWNGINEHATNYKMYVNGVFRQKMRAAPTASFIGTVIIARPQVSVTQRPNALGGLTAEGFQNCAWPSSGTYGGQLGTHGDAYYYMALGDGPTNRIDFDAEL